MGENIRFLFYISDNAEEQNESGMIFSLILNNLLIALTINICLNV